MAKGFNKEVSQAAECAIKYTKLARLERHISALEATKKTLLLPMRSQAKLPLCVPVDVKISLRCKTPPADARLSNCSAHLSEILIARLATLS
jgi:hypothetical protein